MEAKHGHAHISVEQCKKCPDIAISLCVPFKTCNRCLNILASKQTPLSTPICAHSAALAYAVYEHARSKIMGSPLDTIRTRVSHISCAAQKGNFVLSWNTNGTFSSLRKTCGIITKTLVPAKLYSRYAINLRNLGGKPSKAEFNYTAKQFIDAIDKGVSIVAVGKINVDSAKVKLVAEAVDNKIPDQSKPSGESSAPQGAATDVQHSDENHQVLKVPYDVASVVVADYLSSKLGIDTEIDGDTIRILARPAVFNSKRESLKRGVRDYVESKYTKLKDDLYPILAYMAIIKYKASCALVDKIIKSKMTSANLAQAISSHI